MVVKAKMGETGKCGLKTFGRVLSRLCTRVKILWTMLLTHLSKTQLSSYGLCRILFTFHLVQC
jgi:hypothetical protein